MIGIAVLGCGRIGRMHAANIAAHPRARLATVFDVVAEAATEVAQTHDVAVAGSVAAALADPGVDAVLIATATDTHADLIEQAVGAGKAILCEKPIDLSLDRVNRCAERIRGTRVPIQLEIGRAHV